VAVNSKVVGLALRLKFSYGVTKVWIHVNVWNVQCTYIHERKTYVRETAVQNYRATDTRVTGCCVCDKVAQWAPKKRPKSSPICLSTNLSNDLCGEKVAQNLNCFPEVKNRRKIHPVITLEPMLWSQLWQFSEKNRRFSQKTNVMINILHNLALFCVKNANFLRRIFLRKYF
jgi:hypothetical protein